MKEKVYFTSDLHLGHANIIKYCNRPFLCEKDYEEWLKIGKKWHQGDYSEASYRISPESVKIMDDYLIEQINKTIPKDGILWHLGDFTFGDPRPYLERINCRVRNIIGNHDKRSNQRYFDQAYDLYELYDNKDLFVLCHYSMVSWNKSHRGSYMVYGHNHSLMEGYLNNLWPERRSMDIGVDNAKLILNEYRPFSLQEIKSLLNKQGHSKYFNIPEIIKPEE